MSGVVWLFVKLEKVVYEAISSTTRPETEQGPRPIKAGLRGQESGVSGGRQGVENTLLPLSKWGWLAVSDRATFSGFDESDNENLSENRNCLDEIESS